MGDWGCHNLDGVFMALKLGTAATVTVEALQQIGGSEERYPLAQRPSLDVSGRDPQADDSGKVPLGDLCLGRSKSIGTTASRARAEALAKLDEDNPEGEHNRPPIVDEIEKKYGRRLTDGGAVFVGDKGILVAGNYCESPRLVPEEKQKSFPPPPKTLPRVKKGLTITPTSSAPAEKAAPRRARTSTTAARSARSFSWAAWPSGPASASTSSGTPRRWKSRTCPS